MRFDKKLAENQASYPFTYIYFHGSDDSILTTLYLDADLQIRGAEGLALDNIESNKNLFDVKKSNKMMKNIAKELRKVRKDYNELNQKYNDLQEEFSALKFDFELMKNMENVELK